MARCRYCTKLIIWEQRSSKKPIALDGDTKQPHMPECTGQRSRNRVESKVFTNRQAPQQEPSYDGFKVITLPASSYR